MVAKCLAATGYNLARPPVPPTDTQVAAICKKCPDFIEAVSKLTFPDCTMGDRWHGPERSRRFFDSNHGPVQDRWSAYVGTDSGPDVCTERRHQTTAPTSAPTNSPDNSTIDDNPSVIVGRSHNKASLNVECADKGAAGSSNGCTTGSVDDAFFDSKSNGNGSSSSSTEIEAPVVDSASSSDGGATGSITTPKPASTSASLPTKAPASSGVLAAVSTGAVFAASIASFLL
ncbi:hypothetical protein PINS_up020831 [Pythium insidiosum]|nr:hypothetical protein PINS_up020831 [Pythium insidiosum]